LSVFRCTRENPWSLDKTGSADSRIEHTEVEEVGEQEDGWPGGDIVTYRCKICGKMWKAELAQ
jgi:hypothetical protein